MENKSGTGLAIFRIFGGRANWFFFWEERPKDCFWSNRHKDKLAVTPSAPPKKNPGRNEVACKKSHAKRAKNYVLHTYVRRTDLACGGKRWKGKKGGGGKIQGGGEQGGNDLPRCNTIFKCVCRWVLLHCSFRAPKSNWIGRQRQKDRDRDRGGERDG